MKKIAAYIKPFKLEALLSKLPVQGVLDLNVSEVRGYGRQKGKLEQYASSSEFEWTFVPKARVEIYCENGAVLEIEKILIENTRTGRIGDGKVMIEDVEASETV